MTTRMTRTAWSLARGAYLASTAGMVGSTAGLFAAAALCGCSTAKACPDHPQSPCLTTGDIVVAVVVAVASILIVVTGVYMARREELSYYS